MISLLVIDALQPLQHRPTVTTPDGGYRNWAYDEAKWVTIPIGHPCNLKNLTNWSLETHDSITGLGALFAYLPRYYIKKRQGANNRGVQYVALRNPNALANIYLGAGNWHTQLATIFCRLGTMEGVTQGNNPQLSANCQIEEKLVALCLRDRHANPGGDLNLDLNQIFFPAVLNAVPANYAHTTLMQDIVFDNCVKFSRIPLPKGGPTVSRQNILRLYLLGARIAGFDRVFVRGFGVANVCQPTEMSWASLEVNDLLQNRNDMNALHEQSRTGPQEKYWYFCLDQPFGLYL